MKAKGTDGSASATFLDTLEQGVRAVLKDKDAKASERVAAVAAGAKLLMIKHKISEADQDSFFK